MPVARKKLTPVRLVPVVGGQRHQPNALPAGTTRAGETLGRADSRKLSLPPNQLILSLLPQPVGRLRSVAAPLWLNNLPFITREPEI